MDFYIVDAFTNKAFGGNTAGVVIYESLSPSIMQSIAKELRFSETVFIKNLDNYYFDLKYFTPNSEVDLCGHATIAGIKVLFHKGFIKQGLTCNIQTNAGILSVHIDNNIIFMEAGTAIEGNILDSTSIKKLCSAVRIEEKCLGDYNYNLQPQIISTGLYDILLPVKNIAVLNNIKPDYKALAQLSKELNVVGVHAFTLESSDFTAECRNFAPLYEIDEEAATGTSNASLTYYLYKNHVIKELNKPIIFHQGQLLRRPSQITTLLHKSDKLKILIGGSAYILGEGKLNI